jgi:hypothetical protein
MSLLGEDALRELLAKAEGDHARLQVEARNLQGQIAVHQAALGEVRRQMIAAGGKITAFREALGELELHQGPQQSQDGGGEAPDGR